MHSLDGQLHLVAGMLITTYSAETEPSVQGDVGTHEGTILAQGNIASSSSHTWDHQQNNVEGRLTSSYWHETQTKDTLTGSLLAENEGGQIVLTFKCFPFYSGLLLLTVYHVFRRGRGREGSHCHNFTPDFHIFISVTENHRSQLGVLPKLGLCVPVNFLHKYNPCNDLLCVSVK